MFEPNRPLNSFDAISQHWGDILATLKANLNYDEHKMLRRPDGQEEFVWQDAERPMIEDIICALTTEDDVLWEYLKLAGFSLGTRAPRVIELEAGSRTGMGVHSEGTVQK